MLTSPADDTGSWPPCRCPNLFENNTRVSAHNVTENPVISNHTHVATMFQDGNINANTYSQQHMLQDYNTSLQWYNGGPLVRQELQKDSYMTVPCSGSDTMNSDQINYFYQPIMQPEIKDWPTVHHLNMLNEDLWNGNSFDDTLYAMPYKTSYQPYKNLSVPETNIYETNAFHHDAHYSAFRNVYQSDFTQKQDLEHNLVNAFDVQCLNDHLYQKDAAKSCNETKKYIASGEPAAERQYLDSFLGYRTNRNNSLELDKSSGNDDSLCSVTSEETEEFEIINLDKNRISENGDISDQLQLSKAYLTPPTSSQLDGSDAREYKTAPSSPDAGVKALNNVGSDIHIYKDDLEDLTDEFVVINKQDDFAEIKTDAGTIENFQSDGLVCTDLNLKHDVPISGETDSNETKHCSKCGKVIKKTSKTSMAKIPTKDSDSITTESTSEIVELPPEHPPAIQKREVPRLQLPIPPFLSVDSLLYEADPETGTAKVIGRGSFGQVYKVRFSDPNYYHLPIVVKEFLEEFSNSRDIVEEAQRLYYLQDTGYVPVCYGLLCFNDSNRSKYGIVQEYVGTGLTLEQMLWDQYELPIQTWLSISYQCCDGLARFHEKGILLNDIKTNNIIVEFRHNSVKIKYIDFGLATDMRGKRYKNTKSLDNYVYLSPEVRKYGEWTNIYSDIYSLGYMIGQLYTFTGLNVLEVISNLSMDQDPDMRLPVQGASSLIHDSIIRFGFDPGVLCLNI